jgi:uncharacterized membrane protein
MNKPWKLVLVLLGIFVGGGVTGTFVTLRFGREWVVRRPGPDQWAPSHLKKLSEKLALQPDQQEELRPIVRRNMEELSQVRNGCITATKAVFEQMEREVSEKLTPEQRVKYEQLNKEMRERAKKVIPDKNSRPPGPGGPPPGEPGKPSGEMPPPEKPSRGV